MDYVDDRVADDVRAELASDPRLPCQESEIPGRPRWHRVP